MAAPHGLYEEIVIAGFGGQGIILAGKLLAQTAMKAGKEVTYMPSYGAEVRGGTANCMVIISDKPIACPVVGQSDSLIVMNKASLSKFGPRLRAGGLLVWNSCLISSEPKVSEGVDVVAVAADDAMGVDRASGRAIGALEGRVALRGHEEGFAHAARVAAGGVAHRAVSCSSARARVTSPGGAARAGSSETR